MAEDLTVCIQAVPERAALLPELLSAFRAQTVQPKAILVQVDNDHQGPHTRMQMYHAVTTKWMCFFDDDDMPYPNHLETMWRNRDADVIYTRCDTDFYHGYNRPFDGDDLLKESIVPITALFRRRDFQGMWDGPGEDWEMWKRMYRAGLSFLSLEDVTWHYRDLGQSHSKGFRF